MTRRILPATLLLPLLLCIADTAQADYTTTFIPVTITAPAILENPALANMQTWDLMVTWTDPDLRWASACLHAVLPQGNTYYKHPLGTMTKPPPILIIPLFPALEFTSYVTSPRFDGFNGAPAILGPCPPGTVTSLGDSTSPTPGTFSIQWADTDPLLGPGPGTHQLARLTFPQGVVPNVVTLEVTFIPEPTGALLAAVLPIFLSARRSRR